MCSASSYQMLQTTAENIVLLQRKNKNKTIHFEVFQEKKDTCHPGDECVCARCGLLYGLGASNEYSFLHLPPDGRSMHYLRKSSQSALIFFT